MSAHVLDQVEALYRHHVVFAEEAQVVAVVLWAAHTHGIDAFDVTPYLGISSPQRECGKTTLMDLLEATSANPWSTLIPSDAVAFRKIDRDCPTWLLDEVDAIFGPKARDREDLRAILNSGFRRGPKVPRCVGPTQQLHEFSPFCPKAIAGIGQLPDTIASRSIPIRLQKKAKHEKVAKLRQRDLAAMAPLRDKLAEWVTGIIGELREARPKMPDGLSDRAEDAWEPLFAVADAAGGEWPRRARRAAVTLARSIDVEDDSPSMQLLDDASRVILRLPAFGDRVRTEDLLQALRRLPEAPWSDYEGKPLTPHKFAGLLRPYGLRSKLVRVGDERKHGYLRQEFSNVFDRYLPPGHNPFAAAGDRDTGTEWFPDLPPNHGDVTDVTVRPPLADDRDKAPV
jgi:hypothetical protein